MFFTPQNVTGDWITVPWQYQSINTGYQVSYHLWINVVVWIYSVRNLKSHAGMLSQRCVNALHVLIFLHFLRSTQHSDQSRALSLKGALSRCVLYECVETFPSSNSVADDVWLQSVLPQGGVMVTAPIVALMHFPSVSHHDQETGKHWQRKESARTACSVTHTHTHYSDESASPQVLHHCV